MKRFWLLALSLIVTSGSYAIDVENLRCEYMSDPLGDRSDGTASELDAHFK